MFGKHMKLMTLLGFEVKIDASWLLLALLVTWTMAVGVYPYELVDASTALYWLMGLASAVALFASIILHELSHSLVARRYGLSIRGITLFIFGGVAEMADEPPSPKAEFWMAVAGPAASLVIASVFYLVAVWLDRLEILAPAVIVSQHMAVLNVALAVFNMVPAFPLDGGRALRAVLWHRRNDLASATRVAAKMGEMFGYLLIALGALVLVMGEVMAGLWWALIGLFLCNIARAQVGQMQARAMLGRLKVGQIMSSPAATVPPYISLKDFVDHHVYNSFHDIYPVVHNGHLLGLAGVRRLRDVPSEMWDQVSVESILAHVDADNSIDSGRSALQALELMRRSGNSRLVVLSGETLAGMVALKDLIKPIALYAMLTED